MAFRSATAYNLRTNMGVPSIPTLTIEPVLSEAEVQNVKIYDGQLGGHQERLNKQGFTFLADIRINGGPTRRVQITRDTEGYNTFYIDNKIVNPSDCTAEERLIFHGVRFEENAEKSLKHAREEEIKQRLAKKQSGSAPVSESLERMK